MNPIRGLLALLGLALSTLAQAAPPPAEHFFRAPALGAARLSPDGWKVAMRVAAPGEPARLAVYDLKTRQSTVVASFEGVDVGRFEWVNDRRLVLQMNPTLNADGFVDHAPGLFAVDADGGAFRQLVDSRGKGFVRPPSQGRELLHWRFRLVGPMPRQDGPEVLVSRPQEVSRDRVGYHEIQRLDTVTGIARDVDLPATARHWVFGPDGQPRAAVGVRDDRRSLHLRDADGRWRQVAEHHWRDGQAMLPRFAAADGTLYGTAHQGDTLALFRLSPESGQPVGDAVLQSPDFDVEPRFVAARDRLLGLRTLVDGEATAWLDPTMKALQARIDERLAGFVNRLTPPMHGDSPWLLVEAWSDRQPPTTLAWQRESGQFVRLGVSHPEIEPKAMGRTSFHRIAARDGLPLPAYVTLPPGGPAKGLPLVLLVHGGPWVRGAQWRWDPEVQFLATRGHAVLQVEYRGSTGFGMRHFEAGIRQWGQAMQADLADAARWAVAQGVADPKRIALMGGSYGGYATLMGLITDADLFRAGVAWVAVSDPALMFSVHWSDLTRESKQYALTELMGDPVADAEMLRRASPLHRAAELKAPLLLAHGAHDHRVPIVHGEKMRDALKAHHRAVEWVRYEDEGHGFFKPANQVDFWRRVEAFLARELAAK